MSKLTDLFGLYFFSDIKKNCIIIRIIRMSQCNKRKHLLNGIVQGTELGVLIHNLISTPIL